MLLLVGAKKGVRELEPNQRPGLLLRGSQRNWVTTPASKTTTLATTGQRRAYGKTCVCAGTARRACAKARCAGARGRAHACLKHGLRQELGEHGETCGRAAARVCALRRNTSSVVAMRATTATTISEREQREREEAREFSPSLCTRSTRVEANADIREEDRRRGARCRWLHRRRGDVRVRHEAEQRVLGVRHGLASARDGGEGRGRPDP